jgi:hypothetical protein
LPALVKRQVLIQLQGYPTKKLFEGTVVGHLVPPIAEQTPSYIAIEDNTPEKSPINYNINESLNKGEKEALRTLLSEFRDVFATKTSEMGFTNLVEHHINTGEAAPVHSKPYRVSQKERDVIQALSTGNAGTRHNPTLQIMLVFTRQPVSLSEARAEAWVETLFIKSLVSNLLQMCQTKKMRPDIVAFNTLETILKNINPCGRLQNSPSTMMRHSWSVS